MWSEQMKKITFYEKKNVIYKQLKLERVKKGFTQEQLAAKMQLMNVSIDQQAISKIERNARIVTDYELACFCKILEMSVQEMLSDFVEL